MIHLWILLSLFISSLALATPDSGVSAKNDEPDTVRTVDLQRYVGVWHELARLPNLFQEQCVSEISATYRLRQDGRVDVVNRCRTADGSMDEARGLARVVDPVGHSKLEVSFVSLFGWHLFWGDYWILYLDPNYNVAVVGTPNRKYAWVLARSVRLDSNAWEAVDKALRRAGYDPATLLYARDSSRTSTESSKRSSP